MAEGRSNNAISEQLVVTERAVEKHVTSIFGKLGPPPAAEDHRRVLAVLKFLQVLTRRREHSSRRAASARRGAGGPPARGHDGGGRRGPGAGVRGRLPRGGWRARSGEHEPRPVQRRTGRGRWWARGRPAVRRWCPRAREVPLDGDSAVVQVWRTGGPGRVDDYSGMPGRLPEQLSARGIMSSVAGPVTVANRLWGAIVASSGTAHDFPRRPRPSSPPSPSWWPTPWPAPRRASSWPRRARGWWRRATPSAGAWSATSTTARSSGWWRWPCTWPRPRPPSSPIPRGAALLAEGTGRAVGRAGGAARAGPRHPPGRAQRPRPERGPGGAGRALARVCGAGGVHRRARCPRTSRRRRTTSWPRR